MEAQGALKFDPIEVDVDLAKKYLFDHKCDIEKKRLPDNTQLNPQLNPESCKILIEKIKENSQLICQLEYLTCNVPIVVSEINILLILKYLSLDGLRYQRAPLFYGDPGYTFAKDTPLAYYVLFIGHTLATCEERAAVCHLLTKLCCESGFESSFYVNNTLGSFARLGDNTGVISERSDLDSAVDSFLSSPSNVSCFWRLQRIYVQESVYESFKELLDIKTKLKGTNGAENAELKLLCSDLFVYDEKCILVDFAGDVNDSQLAGMHTIFVEAYRTNKELLSLVGHAGLLSLWSSDVAEANELAYNIPASLVWINDYGNFDGPVEISTVLVSLLDLSYKDYISNSFISRYNVWRTYSKEKRLSVFRDVLEHINIKEIPKSNCKEIEKVKIFLDSLKFNAVDVADNKICVTLDQPVGVCRDVSSNDDIIIQSLVLGNGVICYDRYTFPLYDKLSRAGVPIIYYKEPNQEYVKEIKISCSRYRTKVVLTNFGTIFAN
ncbi:uncharacterized protein LOC128677551 [Plodia interpunctella]|uniref:uncharacterized protein LOC128677551 n=1 Tax=Plodia interpunctella TaxID=58824 RepID=UPI0023675D7D|nr:uncharacterized protein LOC128677551 [Plodia interpunctella]